MADPQRGYYRRWTMFPSEAVETASQDLEALRLVGFIPVPYPTSKFSDVNEP